MAQESFQIVTLVWVTKKDTFFKQKVQVVYSVKTCSFWGKFCSSPWHIAPSETVAIMSVILHFDDFLSSEEAVPQNVLLSVLFEKVVSDTPCDGWK